LIARRQVIICGPKLTGANRSVQKAFFRSKRPLVDEMVDLKGNSRGETGRQELEFSPSVVATLFLLVTREPGKRVSDRGKRVNASRRDRSAAKPDFEVRKQAVTSPIPTPNPLGKPKIHPIGGKQKGWETKECRKSVATGVVRSRGGKKRG